MDLTERTPQAVFVAWHRSLSRAFNFINNPNRFDAGQYCSNRTVRFSDMESNIASEPWSRDELQFVVIGQKKRGQFASILGSNNG
jgi:hypothetical protein